MDIDSKRSSNINDIFHTLYPDTDQVALPDGLSIELTDVETLKTELGFSFWYNQIDIEQTCEYDVVIPAGLHMSFCFGGSMKTRTSTDEKGDMSGYMQSLLYLAKDELMTTVMEAQPKFIACGISLSPEFLVSRSHVALAARELISGMKGAFQVDPLQPEIQQTIENLYTNEVDGLGRLLVSEGAILQILGYWQAEKYRKRITNFPNARKALNIKQQIDVATEIWLTPLQLSNNAGVSMQVLNQTFKQLFQRTLSQYIRERKLRLAHELLLAGVQVSQVAYQLEFSPQYLSELFKQQYGESPKSFQIKNR